MWLLDFVSSSCHNTKWNSLAKVSQFGWLGMPTKRVPSQFSELRIDLIVVQDGSWMRIMSKSQLILRIELIIKLFFQISRCFVKKPSDLSKSYFAGIHSWMSWVPPGFLEFSIFLGVLLFVEVMFLERIFVRISVMVALAIETFEWVRARFTFLDL